jgi:alpha-ketoglutarate-dependent taurine dioxygenase
MSSRDSRDPIARRRWYSRRAGIKPRVLRSSYEDLVTFSTLNPADTLPLVIQPNFKSLSLMNWVKNNVDLIEAKLLEHGGILFRGFGLSTQMHFEQTLLALSIPLMHYMEGATPRTELGDRIYTSTEFPPERAISIHNELCYVTTWPMKILFYCVTPAAEGGETPIGDVRKVLQRIPPEIKDRFIQKGWMLLRNFGDGFGLPWQRSYHVSDERALEQYFRSAKISYEWTGPGHLRTRQVRPATAFHPKTNEPVWFNHIGFWHVSSLEQELRGRFLEEFTEEGLPFNTYYGDGSSIPESVIDELRRSYEAETTAFRWQQGDLLMLDNMLVAHGRNPFVGARRILTAMGQPCVAKDI